MKKTNEYLCKLCGTVFKKKLTLKEQNEAYKPKFCTKECAEASLIIKETKVKKQYNRKKLPNISGEEAAFGEILKSYFPQTKIQHKIGDYNHHYDFFIPEIETLVEYNGTYYHSMPINSAKDKKHIHEATLRNTYVAVITDIEWKMFKDSGAHDKQKILMLLNNCTKNSKSVK